MLDSCLWIHGVLGTDPHAEKLMYKMVNHELEVILSSYIASEVVTVLRRLARDLKVPSSVIERDMWAIWLLPSVIRDFNVDITRSLLQEIREQTEIQLLTHILDLELKDIPVVILAYKHKVPLITADKRSLWSQRERIEDLTGVRTILSDDWEQELL